MAEIDAEMMVDQVTMLGLVSREQLQDARAAADGLAEAVVRMMLRKGLLTSWQIDRLKKGDPSGFFFGDAKVLFHLAEGTFARVYRGEHSTTKASLAVKVLRQRFAQMPDAVDRFHKEAEAGMKLNHPNIVQVIDQGRQENRHYMIMEYVEGMNLRDFMKLRTRIPTDQVAAPHARHGTRAQILDGARRHPSRHQGHQHPDLQPGRSQARRFRPGHDAGRGKQAGRQEPADGRLLGARAHLQQPQGRPSL